MTTLLYHTHAYLPEVHATVTRADGKKVVLDQTVFYAQGGGQPADQGLLMWLDGQAKVVDARRKAPTCGTIWMGSHQRKTHASTASSTGTAGTP